MIFPNVPTETMWSLIMPSAPARGWGENWRNTRERSWVEVKQSTGYSNEIRQQTVIATTLMTDYTRKEANHMWLLTCPHRNSPEHLTAPFAMLLHMEESLFPIPKKWCEVVEYCLGPKYALKHPSWLLQKFNMSSQNQDIMWFWLLIFTFFKFKSSSLYPNFLKRNFYF